MGSCEIRDRPLLSGLFFCFYVLYGIALERTRRGQISISSNFVIKYPRAFGMTSYFASFLTRVSISFVYNPY